MKELIIIVETRSSNRSDWMYIKSALDYYYKSRTYGIKKIFATSKTELINQTNKVNEYISKIQREPIVLLCADYDRKEELNEKIKEYCFKNDFNLVWMNLDVEDVFWGKQVSQKDKEKQAINFQKKKNTLFAKGINLSEINPLKKRHTSNLLCVLDSYFERKLI